MAEFEVSYSRHIGSGEVPSLSWDGGFKELGSGKGKRPVSIGFASGDLSLYDMNTAFEFTGNRGFGTEVSLTVPCGTKRVFEHDGVVEIVDIRVVIPGRFIASSAKSGLIGTNRGAIAWCPQLSSSAVSCLGFRYAALSVRGSRRLVWVCTQADVHGVNYEMRGDPASLDELSTLSVEVQANGSVMVIDRSDRRKRRTLAGLELRRGLGLLTLAYPMETRLGDLNLACYTDTSAIEVFERNFCLVKEV